MQVYSWLCSKFETKDNEILTENKSEPFLLYLLTLNPKLTLHTLTSASIFSLLFSLYSLGTDKENLFNNQSFLGWWSFPLFS